MTRRVQFWIFSGFLIGSVWAFSEVFFGSVLLRLGAIAWRSTILTGLGTGILFCGFGYTRQIRAMLMALFTTVIARIVFSPMAGLTDRVVNGTASVLFTGILIIIGCYFLKNRETQSPRLLALTAGSAILISGTLFYIVGTHLKPCFYLSVMTFPEFFLRETAGWVVLSAGLAVLGFRIGTRLFLKYPAEAITHMLPAWGIVTGCWICCCLTVLPIL